LATPQVNSKGNPIPSNLIVVNMSSGTGIVHYGVTSYPVFLFQPPEPVTIQSVQSMALNVIPNADSGDCLLKAFLWDPNNGEWVMFTPVWGGIAIDEPARFVDAQGNIILAMHFQPGSNGVIKDIWLQMTAVDNNGKIISLGGNP
jgi:hypothetical protein